MFLLFFPLFVLAISKDYQTILEIIKRLHDNTEYKTFYEVFGATEFSSISKIQKAYSKLITSKEEIPKFNLSQAESKKLLTNCFDILKKRRAAYDEILNSTYLMYDDSKNYKNSKFMIYSSLFALLLCVDLIYFCYRFAKYCQLSTTEVKSKKKGKKSFIASNMAKPDMYIYKGIRKVMSVFGK